MGQQKIHKRLSALLLILSIGVILYLTFQPQVQTSALSHPVYLWFKSHGFSGTEHELRSWAHIPEYFLIGCTFAYFGRARNWKWLPILCAGSLFGLIDECVKIWLPTREFDLGDWVKDIIGVLLALCLAALIQKWFQPKLEKEK